MSYIGVKMFLSDPERKLEDESEHYRYILHEYRKDSPHLLNNVNDWLYEETAEGKNHHTI